MKKIAQGNRLQCQTPSSAPSQSQTFLLGIATLPHFCLVRDSTPYPYKWERSRREAESEKNLCSGKKILPSRISNPLFEPVSRPKTSGKFEIQTQYFVTHRFILFAHTIYVSASPIRSGYPNQGCVTFFFYRFMRSDAGDHWRTHRPGRVYKRTITR